MSATSELAAVVALLRHGSGRFTEYSAVIEKAGSALELLEREHGLLAAGLLDQAAREIAQWRAQSIQPLSVLDRGFPATLRTAHDRPPLLFLSGRLRPADAHAVAIIGSRRASAQGRQLAAAIARSLTENGHTVVSGLAVGIDTAAHRAALGSGGRTIAVIGTGFAHCYPPENQELQAQIARHGAVVSQFWPEMPAARENFPLRNAVMSGMSLATVVVEASARSGARIQTRQALAQGRAVVLLDRLLSQEWAARLAEWPGVHVVGSAPEVATLVAQLHSGSLTA